MYQARRLVALVAFLVIAIPFIAWAVPTFLNPTPPTKEELKRDRAWVASSPYWWDRQACRWLSVCGVNHIRHDYASLKDRQEFNEFLSSARFDELKKRSSGWIDPSKANTSHKKRDEGNGPSKMRKKTFRGEGNQETQSHLRQVPQYVLDHAPLVHLYSGESFWPSDIAEHVAHMAPVMEGGAPINMSEPLSLYNLDDLNDLPVEMAFLESVDDVEQRPSWLHSHYNTPSSFPEDTSDDEGKGDTFFTDPAANDWSWFDVDHDHPLHGISDPRRLNDLGKDNGAIPRQGSHRIGSRSTGVQAPIGLTPPLPPTNMHKPDGAGYSKAPAVLILVQKGPHILDAFWFFFYSYNLGQTVGGIRFGNHVGDWEHTMVRFEDGIPRAVFMSEHAGGQAYAWDAVEKRKLPIEDANGGVREVERFVLYSAVGSHAMYANPGDHPYVLPFNMLRDQTDRGPMWDPSLNTYSYFYDYRAGLADPLIPEPSETADTAFSPTAEEYLALVASRSEQKQLDVGAEKKEGEFAGDRGLEPTAENPDAATSWFHFMGTWGDETYGLDDLRQYRLFGQYHYLTGPMGPKVKYLDRHKVCVTAHCKVLHRIRKGGTWY